MCGRATTAVGIWTPDGVVLAVDSRIRVTVGNLPVVSDTKCKIVQVGSSYVALAGLIRSDKIDVFKELERAPVGGKNGVFDETVIVVAVRATLESVVRTRRFLANQREISALIATPDGCGWRLCRIRAQPSPGVANGVAVSTILYPETGCGAAGRCVEVIGRHAAVDRRLPKLLGRKWRKNTDLAHLLVSIAADDEPDLVAPPITVLELNSSGAHWRQTAPCRVKRR